MKKSVTLIFAMMLAATTFAIQPEKVKPVKALLSQNYRYKNHTHIYKKIKTDVMQIWE